jgi:hypothetical protein
MPAIAVEIRGLCVEVSSYDPKIAVRRIPALFAEGEPEDRQAAQPRHLQVACRRREARARCAIFQAALAPRGSAYASRSMSLAAAQPGLRQP